jgi:cytochrome bd-type quinol oxidase subunit 2
MLIGAGIMAPLILAYTGWVYWAMGVMTVGTVGFFIRFWIKP